MKVKKGTNRIVLMKFLIGKIRHSVEGLSIDEYLLLYHLYYDLTESKDPKLWDKYTNLFEKTYKLLTLMSRIQVFPVRLNEGGRKTFDNIFDNLLTSREYFGLAGQRDIRQSFKLILSDTLVPKPIPPKRFIGVGYKDKGTRRDPAWDGTPRWQETATYFANLEREAEELDSSISESQEDFDF